MKFKTAYSENPRVQSHPVGPSLTKQSEADATDINLILKKYAKTGVIEHMAKNPGRYENMPDAMDFQEAQNLYIEAQASFDALPGDIRALFENDARSFLEFMENPENDAEAIELGLIPKPEEEPIPEPEPEQLEIETPDAPKAPG